MQAFIFLCFRINAISKVSCHSNIISIQLFLICELSAEMAMNEHNQGIFPTKRFGLKLFVPITFLNLSIFKSYFFSLIVSLKHYFLHWLVYINQNFFLNVTIISILLYVSSLMDIQRQFKQAH